MRHRARSRSVLIAFAAGSLSSAPPAPADEPPGFDQPWLAAAVATEPVCDIFANGYDPTGAAPCATCFDKTKDFDESDVDCGGNWCAACANGLQCTTGTDCTSGKCSSGVCVDSLLISQVQTRGDNGGSDEFVELYNPGSGPVTFDASWSLQARSASAVSCTTATATTRFSGAGQVIPPHGHILFTNATAPAYNGPTAGDATYTTGIPDAASIVLLHDSSVVDALCFYFNATTQSNLTGCAAAYTCEGTPVSNLPHDDSSNSNVDASIERKPGGMLGNGQDTGDNLTDFSNNPNPDPHNLASDPTP